MILISIGGATASGKSKLAKHTYNYLIQKNFRVEIVNCDSRQIYKGLSISSGVNIEEDSGVALIGSFELRARVSVVDYVQEFNRHVDSHKGTLDIVILVGGTGLYAKAITDSYDLTITKPEFQEDFDALTYKLEQLSTSQLQEYLESIDIPSLSALNNSDKNNPRRLKNAILRFTGKINLWYEFVQAPKFTKTIKLWAQINWESNITTIEQNLQNRIKNGMVEEIISLIKIYGEKRIGELGLGYAYGIDLYNKKITHKNWQELTLISEIQYAKRQITWLKQQKDTIKVSQENLITVLNERLWYNADTVV